MKKYLPLLFVLVAACEYNLGPSVVNTNTNTNNIDIHDLVNFVPVPNPSAPVPAPGGGTEVPVPLPSNGQALAQAFATANPALLLNSCQATSGEAAWKFLDGLVQTLRVSDPRWGYVTKSAGVISQDVISYRATSDNTGAWGIDVIVGHCGAAPTFGWQVLGLDENAPWVGTRN